MASTRLPLKVIGICYAILSLPYAALALDLRLASSTNFQHNERTTLPDSNGLMLSPSSGTLRDVVVNSATVVHNIPEDQQEIIYIRNGTFIGKRSSGLNITQWEIDNNHPTHLSAQQKFDAGDATLKIVAAGVLAGIALTAACIVISASCGTYIGNKLGNFVKGVGASGGEAAVQVVRDFAGGAGSALPGPSGAKAKRDTLHEGFGCYWQDQYNGLCHNSVVADPAFDQIVQSDGSDNPPIWSCWQAYTEESDGPLVFGYYSHCFADNEDCELQCGAGNPEVTSPYGTIAEPS